MLNLKSFTFNPFQEHCFVAWDYTGSGIVVDPGCLGESETSLLEDFLASEGISLRAIWLTHGHFDHIYGVTEISRKYSVPVRMHPADSLVLGANAEMARRFGLKEPDCTFGYEPLSEGETLSFGETSFEVIETPGHTPGGVCFYDRADKVLFSGDTLFAGSIGRTDHVGGDYDKLIVSIMDKIMGLDGDVAVLPGHGPSTDIAFERTHNPFLQPFNEPESDSLDWDADGIVIDGESE